MPLHIELDEPDQLKHCYPGQELRGNVVFQLSKQRKITTASITFRGKIDTEHVESRRGAAGVSHGPRSHSQEVIRLFEDSHILFQGPFDVPPQTFSWPFAITIPTYVEHRRRGNTSPGFIPDGVSTLPPSIDWSDIAITHDAKGRIKYKLVARIESGGLFNNEDVEVPITILSFATVPPPKPQLLTHQFSHQRWPSRELRGQPHTLRQKFKHITSKDPELKTPCIAFDAWVHFPLQLALHQKTAIAFSTQHHRVTPNDPEAPDLILHSLRLDLKSITSIKVVRNRMSVALNLPDRHCTGRADLASHSITFPPTHLDLNGKDTCISSDICLADWWQDKNHSKPVVGDFDTYTVSRRHLMNIKADVRHPPTGHVFHMTTEFRFELLDEYMPAMAQSMEVSAVSRGQTTRHKDIDPELPAYHEDVRPPEAVYSREADVPTKS